jgi:hypothetical protein
MFLVDVFISVLTDLNKKCVTIIQTKTRALPLINVVTVVVRHLLPPPSSSYLSRELFDCCVLIVGVVVVVSIVIVVVCCPSLCRLPFYHISSSRSSPPSA